MAMKSVYSESFFNIPHPGSPWVSVQLRTKIEPAEDISTSKHWESITFNPSNHFENMVIKDAGGAQQLTLNLFDKNFGPLENKIIKALIAPRIANKGVKDPEASVDETGYFEFIISKNVSANLRIRFGYSDLVDSESYIDETSFSSEEWIKRIDNEKSVIRSPWIYFQIMNAKFTLNEAGFRAGIEAVSIFSNFISRAKFVNVFAQIFGKPEDVIRQIESKIQKGIDKAKGGGKYKVTFDIADKPLGYPIKNRHFDGEGIEVMLGSEASVPQYGEGGTVRTKTLYKSVKNILDEICTKVKPILYTDEDEEIKQTQDSGGDASGMGEDNEKAAKVSKYAYSIIEKDDETVVKFYYRDPNKQFKKQKTVRVYPWLNNGMSLISNFDINTDLTFSQLNLPILTVSPDKDGENDQPTLQVTRGKDASVDDNDDDDSTNEKRTDFTVGYLKDVSEAINSDDFDATFVASADYAQSYDMQGGQMSTKQAATMMARTLVANINENVFNGTITIPGDPFYMFDESVTPFSYLIKIVVQRPNYIDENGDFVSGSISYVSGWYVIKSIEHTVGTGGFQTKLELMKFPRKKSAQ